jgi:hypothetical protein
MGGGVDEGERPHALWKGSARAKLDAFIGCRDLARQLFERGQFRRRLVHPLPE